MLYTHPRDATVPMRMLVDENTWGRTKSVVIVEMRHWLGSSKLNGRAGGCCSVNSVARRISRLLFS